MLARDRSGATGHGSGPTPRGVEWSLRRAVAVTGVATLAGLSMVAPAQAAVQASAAPAGAGPTVSVVVSSAPGNVGDPVVPAAAVQASETASVHDTVSLDGVVTQDLPAASGVVANVDPGQLAALQANPALVVTPDVPVTMADGSFGPTRAPAAVFPQTTGASQLWGKKVDGTGITVAVLDTGIAKLPDFGPRLIGGVDLSGEGNPFRDSYGHGTFVAGLIAGNGASSKHAYTGEAPGANLVAVKVAGASGVTDLATVIAGINWVVNHRDQYKIKVLNLSLGAIPTSSTVLNPLDQAVETAWQAGITVVASAGNSGPGNGTIVSPGDDPLAITVGAIDDNGSTDPTAATATTFSSVGPTNIDGLFKPDLATSGRSVVSLRVPGSTIDVANPTAQVGTANFVGSGTSFSAAIVSGAAALVIQGAAPLPGPGKLTTKNATPDQVKAQLLGTAAAGPVGNPTVDGHGDLNAYAAVMQPGLRLTQTVPSVATNVGDDVDLASTWAMSSWNLSRWAGSTWTGSLWDGSRWDGSRWDGMTWDGTSWNGTAWDGSSWNGSRWDGSTWNGSRWDGTAWDGSLWDGSRWDGSTWNGSRWDGSVWH
jgi:serine protease AprX